MRAKVPVEKQNNNLLAVLPDLKRFALSLTRNRDQAEDLVQDTSLRVMRKGMPDDADMRRWAFRVCKNIWIDQLRKQKVRLETATEENDSSIGAYDGQADLEGRSELDCVMTLMASLPQDQQIALSLVAIEGMSYREVAEIMDVPIGTVMSRISRARGSIADRLLRGKEKVSG